MGGTRLRIGKDLYRSRCVRALPCNNSRAESVRAETGGKTDGVIAGDHAAMYADRFKIFWNHRSVCSTASGFISETVE